MITIKLAMFIVSLGYGTTSQIVPADQCENMKDQYNKSHHMYNSRSFFKESSLSASSCVYFEEKKDVEE